MKVVSAAVAFQPIKHPQFEIGICLMFHLENMFHTVNTHFIVKYGKIIERPRVSDGKVRLAVVFVRLLKYFEEPSLEKTSHI